MVVQTAPGDGTAQHFFQTDHLGSQLEDVTVIGFILSPLVLHRQHLPQPPVPCQMSPFFSGICLGEFHHIADSRSPQGGRTDPQTPHRHHPGPFFHEPIVVGILVDQLPLCRQAVLLPLLVNVDQGPLAPAKDEMLDS